MSNERRIFNYSDWMTPQDRERLDDKYHEAVQEIKELTDEYNISMDENERLNNVIADSIIETQQLRAKLADIEADSPVSIINENVALMSEIAWLTKQLEFTETCGETALAGTEIAVLKLLVNIKELRAKLAEMTTRNERLNWILKETYEYIPMEAQGEACNILEYEEHPAAPYIEMSYDKDGIIQYKSVEEDAAPAPEKRTIAPSEQGFGHDISDVVDVTSEQHIFVCGDYVRTMNDGYPYQIEGIVINVSNDGKVRINADNVIYVRKINELELLNVTKNGDETK